MTEREFRGWQQYAARKMLPHRRIELYLARIAMLIAQTMGGHKHAKLSDYLFDPEPLDAGSTEDFDDDDELVDTARDFFGFRPVK